MSYVDGKVLIKKKPTTNLDFKLQHYIYLMLQTGQWNDWLETLRNMYILAPKCFI